MMGIRGVWYLLENENLAMAKNKSIFLGNPDQTALGLFEDEEPKKLELIIELKKGEKSGFVNNFNRDKFLTELHKKFS